jgi:hypothetical protein
MKKILKHSICLIPLFLGYFMLVSYDCFWQMKTRFMASEEKLILSKEFPYYILHPGVSIFLLIMVLIYIVHAFVLRKEGWGIVFLKLAIIPFYCFFCLISVFHVD